MSNQNKPTDTESIKPQRPLGLQTLLSLEHINGRSCAGVRETAVLVPSVSKPSYIQGWILALGELPRLKLALGKTTGTKSTFILYRLVIIVAIHDGPILVGVVRPLGWSVVLLVLAIDPDS